MEETAIMAAEEEGGGVAPRRGEGGTELVGVRDDGGGEEGGLSRPPQGERGAERTAERAGPDGTVADVDPWSSFFEMFWGPAEGESTDRDEGGRQPVKGARKTGAERGRQGCLLSVQP